MAAKWEPKDKEIYKAWVRAIVSECPELNEWEMNFLVSVQKRLLFGTDNLTEAQAKKLEELYAEKTK